VVTTVTIVVKMSRQTISDQFSRSTVERGDFRCSLGLYAPDQLHEILENN